MVDGMGEPTGNPYDWCLEGFPVDFLISQPSDIIYQTWLITNSSTYDVFHVTAIISETLAKQYAYMCAYANTNGMLCLAMLSHMIKHFKRTMVL